MKTLRHIAILLTALLFALPLAAQAPDSAPGDREKWMKEMREYKHSFLAKELGLSREQQRKFFALYDEMEDQTAKLGTETRQLEMSVAKAGENASDDDLQKATDALFSLKMKEGEIEKSYQTKFQSILTKQQLFQLKGAERRYARDIMKHHSRLRSKAKKQ